MSGNTLLNNTAPRSRTPLTDVHLTIQQHTKRFSILTTSCPWPVAEMQATCDVYTATKADRCESRLPLLPAAITTLQYQPASPSSLRHPIDTSGNNGEHYEIIDVTRHFLFININQLDALNFITSLFQASTCSEHMCSSSGGQNYIIQSLVSSHYPIGGRPVHRTATYRCDDTRGCVVQFWPPDDEHLCSKHVEALNKLIIKFGASSWLILR